jgi:hypothetical protein
LLLAGPARADEVDDLLKDLRAVKANGSGAARARAAYDRLVRHGPKVLPRILAAMDTPEPVAANWLRLAFDAIVEPEIKSGGKAIDADALLAFVRDAKKEGRARRFGLDVVERLRPGTRGKLLPGWIDDPEFGFDAIERLLERIRKEGKGPKDRIVADLRRAFAGSRDLDQARAIAALLRDRGVTVNVAEHLGFLGEWYVVGPFDANGRKGFKTVYPPERKVDLDAVMDGQKGKKLRWHRLSLPDSPRARFPIFVDLTKPLGNADDAVAYAWTAFRVPTARTVEFRGAADDNLTVWVNGKRVFGFEEYQNGVRLDRHRFRVPLRAGVNTVLLKVCQAPLDPDNPAPNWEFLLRIIDPTTGRGVVFPTTLK